jgi:adenylate kinase family enzyme/predicted house-cleaning noncanonical NTP pyrophosphatase (MazG superfamily)
MSAEDFSCFFRSCGLDATLVDLLRDEPMAALRSFVKTNNIDCAQLGDARVKEEVCEAIMSDSIEKLAKSSSQICMSIMRLVNFPKARLAKQDRKLIHRIMSNFRIEAAGMTDREKCQAIQDHYHSVLQQITHVERLERQSGGQIRFPNVKKILLTLLFAYSATALPVCSAESQQCTMRVATSSNGFSRVFVNGDIRPEVSQMGYDPELIQEAKSVIYNAPRTGQQYNPVATFLLGGSGAGKTTSFANILATNPEIQQGVSGALEFNTDDIMGGLPGYKAMMELGTLDNMVVSNQMAADVFHEPAEEIGRSLINETVDNQRSFIFDGTGNNLKKLQAQFHDLKLRGYQVNVVVVTADASVRMERAEKRGIRTGRWIPPEVVAKGYDSETWQSILSQYAQDGIVDNFEIVENN